jgi:hypothetical protein
MEVQVNNAFLRSQICMCAGVVLPGPPPSTDSTPASMDKHNTIVATRRRDRRGGCSLQHHLGSHGYYFVERRIQNSVESLCVWAFLVELLK